MSKCIPQVVHPYYKELLSQILSCVFFGSTDVMFKVDREKNVPSSSQSPIPKTLVR